MAGDGGATETELKLKATPQTLAKLRQSPLFAACGGGRAVSKTLISAYYDTAEQALQERLATLRVRKTGDNYIQTLKSAAHEPGGLTRSEWEWPVAGPNPDLSVIVEPEALALLGSVDAGALRLVFESRIKRTVRMLGDSDNGGGGGGGGGDLVEAAFDVGELRTPDGAVLPLAELELELKAGAPSALFALALEIAKLAPVRLETRTKAARGFALAAGRTEDGWSKAERLRLSADQTAEAALCAILRNGLNHFAANEASALAGTDPEGVHQMRVALRRLRSAVALFRRFIPTDRYFWLTGELRWLAGSLGQARDWDVFLSELVAPVKTGLGPHSPFLPDIATLEAAAETRRAAGYDAVRQALLSERYGRFQLELAAWVEGRGWRAQPVSESSVKLFAPIGELADSLLDKRMRRARRAGRGFAHLAATRRHELRIALKKLRYAADFFRDLYDDKPTRRFVAQLADLQDALGHLNDVATAGRLIQSLHDDGSMAPTTEARAAGLVVGWHARGLATSEPQLVAAWESFAAAKPFWSKPSTTQQAERS
jgi:triphosphatase